VKTANVTSEAQAEWAGSEDLVKRSLLYRELHAEREEILRHKWFESEKAGRDIGYDLAQVDWHIKHRPQWTRERRAERKSSRN
jgi:hypothetical protein